jgi:hypothetical protein
MRLSNWEVDRGRHDLMRLRRHSHIPPRRILSPTGSTPSIHRGSRRMPKFPLAFPYLLTIKESGVNYNQK